MRPLRARSRAERDEVGDKRRHSLFERNRSTRRAVVAPPDGRPQFERTRLKLGALTGEKVGGGRKRGGEGARCQGRSLGNARPIGAVAA